MRRTRTVFAITVLTVVGTILSVHPLYADRGPHDDSWGGPKAAFLCPPVPVAVGDTCECEFFNYGFFPKKVSIQLFSALGDPAANNCSDVLVQPQRGTECTLEFQGQDTTCGCSIQVEGSGGDIRARASINVVVPDSQPRAWDGRACSGPSGR